MLSVGALCANMCRHTFLSIVVIWKISLSSAFTFFFPLHYIRRDITHDLYFIFTLILLKVMQTAQAEIFYYFVAVTFFFFFKSPLHCLLTIVLGNHALHFHTELTLVLMYSCFCLQSYFVPTWRHKTTSLCFKLRKRWSYLVSSYRNVKAISTVESRFARSTTYSPDKSKWAFTEGKGFFR